MPSASSNPPSSLGAQPMSFATVPVTFEAPVRDTSSALPAELGRAAHRAVESALAMADHFAAGDQRGVNLQFSVSGMDLAVRVELRPDGVHTTFRTESPELRAALATEWHAVVASQPADRPQRLAEPQFTAGNGAQSAGAESGTAHHRESSARQGQPDAPANSAFRMGARSTPATPSMSSAIPVRVVPLATARHLHTFA